MQLEIEFTLTMNLFFVTLLINNSKGMNNVHQ